VPYLLRSINKRKWDWSAGNPPWLIGDAIPAAPFGDVSPSADSELSVWWVPDDKSNVHRVVTAIAAGRQHPDKFDYALIEEGALRELGFVLQQVAESCPDPQASEQWHHNLKQLTADDLRRLVDLIKRTAELDRVQGPQVKKLLTAALDARRLDETKVNSKLLEVLRSQPKRGAQVTVGPSPSVRSAPSNRRRILTMARASLTSTLRACARFLRR